MENIRASERLKEEISILKLFYHLQPLYIEQKKLCLKLGASDKMFWWSIYMVKKDGDGLL